MIFISLDYSPWSEKARWVLDWSGVSYTNKPYISMAGVPWLRLKTKKFRGQVSVPVLLDQKHVLSDSLDIAKWADNKRIHKHKPSLFPCGDSVDYWNALSERALALGRYASIIKQLQNRKAQQEILPAFIPAKLKPFATWLARSGLQYHLKKYHVESPDEAFREILLKLRAQLAGGDYILDDFSYCDIAMALTLQYVKPVTTQYSAQGPAAAQCWANPALAEEFPDLIAWRDRIYHRYR